MEGHRYHEADRVPQCMLVWREWCNNYGSPGPLQLFESGWRVRIVPAELIEWVLLENQEQDYLNHLRLLSLPIWLLTMLPALADNGMRAILQMPRYCPQSYFLTREPDEHAFASGEYEV